MGTEELVLEATLEADAADSGPFLSLDDPTASAVTQYIAYSRPESGTQQRLESLQTGASFAAEFRLRGGIPKPVYLNLSKPIIGTIYVSNMVNEAASSTDRGFEATTIRIEVLSSRGRVAVVESGLNPGHGLGNTAEPSDRTYPWIGVSFQARSEVHNFTAEEELTIRVGRTGGLGTFLIGTGGEHQSMVRFHYFDVDPLAGNLYIEDGVLYSTPIGRAISLSPPGIGAAPLTLPPVQALPAPGSEGDGASLLILAGAPAAMVMATGRARRGKGLVLALVAASLLAGCTGSGQPRAAPVLGSGGNGPGEIRGIIDDGDPAFPRPLADASAGILSSHKSTTTNSRGEYVLDGLEAGTYIVRFQATDFDAQEHELEVRAGATTWFNVSLQRPLGWTANQRPHPHGQWPDSGEIELYQDTVPLADAVSTTDYGIRTNGRWVCGSGLTNLNVCEVRIPVPADRVVQAGAGRVTVTLSWAGSFAPHELGLRVLTAGNISADQIFGPRPAGEPFTIAFFPHEADPGHQTVTEWSFFVRTPFTNILSGDRGVGYEINSLSADIRAFRNVLALEPSHRDLWEGRDSLVLFKSSELATQYCGSFTSAADEYPGPACQLKPQGSQVPPGAKEIRGTLRWQFVATAEQKLDPGTAFGISYRPANVAEQEPTYTPAPTQTPGEEKVTFVIPVKAEEVDQFYQRHSLWGFYPDDRDDPKNDYYKYYGANFWLDAEVIRDPDYRPV